MQNQEDKYGGRTAARLTTTTNTWPGQQYSLKLEKKDTHYKYSHRNMKEDRIK